MTRQKEQGANKEKEEPQQQDDDTHTTTKDGPGASAAVAPSQDAAIGKMKDHRPHKMHAGRLD